MSRQPRALRAVPVAHAGGAVGGGEGQSGTLRLSRTVSRDAGRVLAVLPVGVGVRVPELAEAADLTLPHAQRALSALAAVGAAAAASQRVPSGTIERWSRVLP